MILVGVMAAAIWFSGMVTGAPRQARLLMLGILLVAVLALHVVLPDGHPLREATGGDPRLWILLVAAVAAAVGYGRVLARVRAEAHARQTPAPPPPGSFKALMTNPFSDAEIVRYARHVALREVGGTGQRRLKDARVLVIGAGGLGAPALLYLGAAGVGTIGLIDPDVVEPSNLQRQVIFRDADLGRPKVQAAADAVHAQNPFITLRPYNRAFDAGIAEDLLRDYDLVLDGTDGWETRALANRAAVAAGVPLLAGAIAQWDGQVSLWDPARGGPCHACVFPSEPAPGLSPSCAEAGVAGPLPGVIGTMMALEAVKHLTDAGSSLRGRMLLWDGLGSEGRTIETEARADCPVCRGRGLRAA